MLFIPNPTTGSTLSIGATAVVIASDQGNIPVTIQNTPTVTLSSGTLTTLSTLTGGSVAEGSATSVNPLIAGGVVRTAALAAQVAGNAIRTTYSSGGAQVIVPYAVPEVTWNYAAAASGIANTNTAVTVKTAGASGIRNYITGLTLMSEALTTATEFCIRDGAAGTVLWRQKIPTTGLTAGIPVRFDPPLRGTAATLVEIVTLTASGAGAVYANLTGFQAA